MIMIFKKFRFLLIILILNVLVYNSFALQTQLPQKDLNAAISRSMSSQTALITDQWVLAFKSLGEIRSIEINGNQYQVILQKEHFSSNLQLLKLEKPVNSRDAKPLEISNGELFDKLIGTIQSLKNSKSAEKASLKLLFLAQAKDNNPLDLNHNLNFSVLKDRGTYTINAKTNFDYTKGNSVILKNKGDDFSLDKNDIGFVYWNDGNEYKLFGYYKLSQENKIYVYSLGNKLMWIEEVLLEGRAPDKKYLSDNIYDAIGSHATLIDPEWLLTHRDINPKKVKFNGQIIEITNEDHVYGDAVNGFRLLHLKSPLKAACVKRFKNHSFFNDETFKRQFLNHQITYVYSLAKHNVLQNVDELNLDEQVGYIADKLTQIKVSPEKHLTIGAGEFIQIGNDPLNLQLFGIRQKNKFLPLHKDVNDWIDSVILKSVLGQTFNADSFKDIFVEGYQNWVALDSNWFLVPYDSPIKIGTNLKINGGLINLTTDNVILGRPNGFNLIYLPQPKNPLEIYNRFRKENVSLKKELPIINRDSMSFIKDPRTHQEKIYRISNSKGTFYELTKEDNAWIDEIILNFELGLKVIPPLPKKSIIEPIKGVQEDWNVMIYICDNNDMNYDKYNELLYIVAQNCKNQNVRCHLQYKYNGNEAKRFIIQGGKKLIDERIIAQNDLINVNFGNANAFSDFFNWASSNKAKHNALIICDAGNSIGWRKIVQDGNQFYTVMNLAQTLGQSSFDTIYLDTNYSLTLETINALKDKTPYLIGNFGHANSDVSLKSIPEYFSLLSDHADFVSESEKAAEIFSYGLTKTALINGEMMSKNNAQPAVIRKDFKRDETLPGQKKKIVDVDTINEINNVWLNYVNLNYNLARSDLSNYKEILSTIIPVSSNMDSCLLVDIRTLVKALKIDQSILGMYLSDKKLLADSAKYTQINDGISIKDALQELLLTRNDINSVLISLPIQGIDESSEAFNQKKAAFSLLRTPYSTTEFYQSLLMNSPVRLKKSLLENKSEAQGVYATVIDSDWLLTYEDIKPKSLTFHNETFAITNEDTVYTNSNLGFRLLHLKKPLRIMPIRRNRKLYKGDQKTFMSRFSDQQMSLVYASDHLCAPNDPIKLNLDEKAEFINNKLSLIKLSNRQCFPIGSGAFMQPYSHIKELQISGVRGNKKYLTISKNINSWIDKAILKSILD